MTEAELTAWLQLVAIPNVGVSRIQRLLAYGKPQQLLAMPREQLLQIGLTAKQIAAFYHPNQRLLQQALEWQQYPQQHIITLECEYYPYLLKQITSPPPILFVRGDLNCLSAPQIAVIGSRSASIDGRESAFNFSKALATDHYVVTSGLALGIDGQAHLGALKAGGMTIAVLGSGLDRIYPARHRSLAANIAENGALVSEFWPQESPRAQNFPRRNRVISGLSIGVLVVEAAIKSGSLITARYALEQDREVFALPGSIHNPVSRGCNALIKSGAKLVESPTDIYEEVGSLTECAISNQIGVALASEENEELPFPALLANVGTEATPVDVVAERCEQSIHQILPQLLELELSGWITAVPGGYIRTRRG